MNREDYSRSLIREIATNKPFHKFACCFSGGKDSLVATHLVTTSLPKERWEVIFVDTTTCHPKTMSYVETVSEQFGWDVKILKPKKTFDEYAKKWGLPDWYDMRWCMRVLKLEPIVDFTGRALYIQVTGIRKDESIRRLLAFDCVKEFERMKVKGGWRYLLAPLLRWTSEDVKSYIERYNLPCNSDVWNLYHFSGDCFCFAFPKLVNLSILRWDWPEMFQRLKEIEKVRQKITGKLYTFMTKKRSIRDMESQELLSKYICPCEEHTEERSPS